MTLTEQWKKGELKSGWYFVKVGKYEAEIDLYDDDHSQWFNSCDKDIYPVEVLAPVPSYEEWKNVTTCFDYEHKAYLSMVEENKQLRKWCEEFNALDVAKENQQLKELLSKCLDELAEFNNSYYPETQELFSQITNAIGEK